MELSTIPAILLTLGLTLGLLISRRSLIGGLGNGWFGALLASLVAGCVIMAATDQSFTLRIVLDQRMLMLTSLVTALAVETFFCYNTGDVVDVPAAAAAANKVMPRPNQFFLQQSPNDEQQMMNWENEDSMEAGDKVYQSCDVDESVLPKPMLFNAVNLDQDEDSNVSDSNIHLHLRDVPGPRSSKIPLDVSAEDYISPKPGTVLSVTGPFPHPSSLEESPAGGSFKTYLASMGLMILGGLALSPYSISNVMFQLKERVNVPSLGLVGLIPLGLYVTAGDGSYSSRSSCCSTAGRTCSTSLLSYSSYSPRRMFSAKSVVVASLVTSVVWCALGAAVLGFRQKQTEPSFVAKNLNSIIGLTFVALVVPVTMYISRGSNGSEIKYRQRP